MIKSGKLGTLVLVASLLAVGASALTAGAATPNPRKVVAVVDTGWRTDYHPLRNTVSYFDVTDLGTAGYEMKDNLLFSAWIGYERLSGTNKEELESMTLNPSNGFTYLAGYDSGTGGTGDGFDSNGDWDLYGVDYQQLLADFEANNRPMGTVYVPSTGPDGEDYETLGVTHPTGSFNFVYSDGIQKLGELARNGDSSGVVTNAAGSTITNTGSGEYYSPDIDFVNAQKIVALGDTDFEAGNDFWYNNPASPTEEEKWYESKADHRVVAWERVDTASGNATHDAPNREGGYNQATQSWETKDLGLVNMDGFFNATGGPGYNPALPADEFVGQGMSEVIDMEYVSRSQEGAAYPLPPGGSTTVDGVWLAEGDTPVTTSDDVDFKKITGWDGGGDDLVYQGGFRPDNIADPNDNAGDLDWVKVDENGAILYGESGYFDAPSGSFGQEGLSHEPKVFSRSVLDYEYTGQDGDTFAWLDNDLTMYGPIPDPASDDDGVVTDGRFVAYDKGENRVYYFDIDGSPDFKPDLYVYDLDDNAFVHEELDALGVVDLPNGVDGAIYSTQHGLEFFVRGDTTMDGQITAADIDLVADTLTGSAVDKETYDLTGDDDLTGADVDELVLNILGTYKGDANLDCQVDVGDLGILAGNWSGSFPGSAWAKGDFTGDGLVDVGDLGVLAGNWNAGVGVPEPTALALLSLGGLALIRRRK